MGSSECRAWFEGDPILEAYHDHEWCKPSHDDRFQFEMLCLEGASVGLSWKTIMHKRAAYRTAFCEFDIDACAALTDEYLAAQLQNPGIIRNRAKMRFSELVDDRTPASVVVVSFLAILELYKRSMIRVRQVKEFGDIELRWIEGAPALVLQDTEEVAVGLKGKGAADVRRSR